MGDKPRKIKSFPPADLSKLTGETDARGTVRDLAVVLGLTNRYSGLLSVSAMGDIVMDNAKARRLLALAIKGVQSDYVWPDPHSNGWIDAWNGYYDTEAEARRDGAAGVGRPWVLAYGEGLITEAEMERRLADQQVVT